MYGTEVTARGEGLKIETLETGSARAQLLRQPDTAFGTVVQNYILTSVGAPVKRHIGRCYMINPQNTLLTRRIEFALPEGSTYSAGDYLAMYIVFVLL